LQFLKIPLSAETPPAAVLLGIIFFEVFHRKTKFFCLNRRSRSRLHAAKKSGKIGKNHEKLVQKYLFLPENRVFWPFWGPKTADFGIVFGGIRPFWVENFFLCEL
jgi:hypothetical protein